MAPRCSSLPSLALLAALGLAHTAPSTHWSSISFLEPGQASKRSADTEAGDLDLAGSDTQYDVAAYSDLALSAPAEDLESRVEPFRRRKYRRRRRKNRYEAPLVVGGGGALSDSKLYDRDSSYSAPAAGYNAPESSYEAPSYSSYEAPSYDAPSYKPSYEAYSGGGKDSFNDFLNALAAFLPIGLFLAAIPPNLIVINSRRRRAAGEEEDLNSVETVYHPFLDKIDRMGLAKLGTPQCQKELFCEMAAMGEAEHEANTVQRLLAALVRHTPASLADTVGVTEVFQASKTRRCEQFKCMQ